MSQKSKLLLIGLCGLAVGTTLSIVFSDAAPLPGTAIMLILSISAGFCGASIPGMMRLDAKWIRATGAIAFAVLPWVVPAAPLDSDPAEAEAPPAAAPTPGPAGTSSKPATRPRIRVPPPTVTRPRTILDSVRR